MTRMVASPLPRPGPESALLLDAAGTLLHPREPIAATYARFARSYGCTRSAAEIGAAFSQAMRELPTRERGSRDWRSFWTEVVARSTGVAAPALVDVLIEHFAHAPAWQVAHGAARCLASLRDRGMKLGLVSNWSAELRPLLGELEIDAWFDTIVISAEEGIEKPDPEMFVRACARLGLGCDAAVHVGDSRRADVEGARAAGCAALHFGHGHDVADFDELAARLLDDRPFDQKSRPMSSRRGQGRGWRGESS